MGPTADGVYGRVNDCREMLCISNCELHPAIVSDQAGKVPRHKVGLTFQFRKPTDVDPGLPEG